MWYIEIIKQVMQEKGLSQQAFADISLCQPMVTREKETRLRQYSAVVRKI